MKFWDSRKIYNKSEINQIKLGDILQMDCFGQYDQSVICPIEPLPNNTKIYGSNLAYFSLITDHPMFGYQKFCNCKCKRNT